MSTSAQPLRLYIDLDICSSQCEKCTVECSYYYHQQRPVNNGIISIKELATYAIVCRRCEEPHCVNACPKEALSQQKDKEQIISPSFHALCQLQNLFARVPLRDDLPGACAVS